ncbi:MAG TPA: hypothetical protein VI076_03925, partial [Actinopolymorphaceae bacterium]
VGRRVGCAEKHELDGGVSAVGRPSLRKAVVARQPEAAERVVVAARRRADQEEVIPGEVAPTTSTMISVTNPRARAPRGRSGRDVTMRFTLPSRARVVEPR